MRLSALAFILVVALSSGEARADLRAARSHLAAGRFELVLEDLADTGKFPAAEVADVFADAADLALAKGDRSLAGIYCERAISRVPKHAKALRTCSSVALEDGRFLEARDWSDTLGAMLPKDGEVALLRARASKSLESWEMVVAILEPFESDKGLEARVGPLLAEARERSRPVAQAGEKTQEQSLEDAVRAARELDRKNDASETVRSSTTKRWRPMGERVVLYATRRCKECDDAREWLQRHEVDFEEKNADSATYGDRNFMKHCDLPPGSRKRMLPVDGPRPPNDCRVPLILVNDTPVKGFDERLLKQLLDL